MGRVLVIDDDESFRAMVAAQLRALGHEVLEAGTALRGTQTLAAEQLDLVIVDGLLPDMDGVRWIERTRASGNQIALVLVSAFSIARDKKLMQRLSQDLGVKHVLPKPIVPVVFSAQMNALLPAAVADPTDDAFEREMQELRDEYMRELPEKLEAMATALSFRNDLAKIQEGVGLAHRLRGSAGSYGREDISALCGHIEDTLRGVSSGQYPNAQTWDSVDGLLRDLGVGEEEIDIEEVEAHLLAPTLLLVSGDHRDRQMFERLLRELRGQLVVTLDPLAASGLVRTTHATAVLLAPAHAQDLHMLQLADALRSMSDIERPNLGLLAMRDTPELRMMALHLGASVFMSRPLRAESLRPPLRTLLTGGAMRRPHVLLAGPLSVELRARLEQQRIRVTLARSGLDALDILERDPPHLAVLDTMLAGVSGFDLCRLLHTVGGGSDVPVWLRAEAGTREYRLAAFAAGADDVLTDPIDPGELAERIKHRAAREQRMHDTRSRDPLTGVYNRQTFYRLAQPLLQRGAALVRVRVVDFAGLNAREGHEAADHVLATLGEFFFSHARPEDLAARVSGSEFVVLLSGEPEHSARALLKSWLEELSAHKFDGISVHFDTVVRETPRDGQDLDQLLA